MQTIPFFRRVSLIFYLISCIVLSYGEASSLYDSVLVPCFYPRNEDGNPLMIDRKTLEIGYALENGSILWRNRKQKWMFVTQKSDSDAYVQSTPVPKGIEEKINYALFPRDFSIPKDLQVQKITGPDGARIFKIVYRRDGEDYIPCEIIIYGKNEYNEETLELLYPLSAEIINKVKFKKNGVLLDLVRPFGGYAFILKKNVCSEYFNSAQIFEFKNGIAVKIVYLYGWPCKIVEYIDKVEKRSLEIPSFLVARIKQDGLGELIVEKAFKDMDYRLVLKKYPQSEIYIVNLGV